MSMMSENINELFAALAKAQGKIENAYKKRINPHFKSRYSDLAGVWDACREPLSENGLSVIQTISHRQDGTFLCTTLGHSSGQWIRSEMYIEPLKGPQALGSALTYYRRYSLAAIVGVASDDEVKQKEEREDDDGNGFQEAYQANESTRHMERTLNTPKLSEKQVEELREIMQECDPKHVSFLMSIAKQHHGADNLNQIPASSYGKLKDSLIKNREENKKLSLACVGGEK